MSVEFWSQVHDSIFDKDLDKFESLLNQEINFSEFLKPRIINETLLKCLSISSSNGNDGLSLVGSNLTPTELVSAGESAVDGCEFIELFILKLHDAKYSSFFCWDDTCKSIVKVFINQLRQFTPYSICFLLRCNDVDLVKEAFENDLVDQHCFGDCLNWHLMFVASYQERFFTHCFDHVFEGFLARFILLCKLRCCLKQKRSFLTWFAGSLHLYTDEYFVQNEEVRFKYVLVKLFESLILNGLLSNIELKNLLQMLVKRNEDMQFTMNTKSINSTAVQNNTTEQYNVRSDFYQTNSNGSLLSSTSTLTQPRSSSSLYLSALDTFYPLSLKNTCRLVIKRSMTKYTKKYIDQLPLPANLKRFVLFENECDSVYKSFSLMKKAQT